MEEKEEKVLNLKGIMEEKANPSPCSLPSDDKDEETYRDILWRLRYPSYIKRDRTEPLDYGPAPE